MLNSLSKTNQKLTAAQRRACWFWCCMCLVLGKGVSMHELYQQNRHTE